MCDGYPFVGKIEVLPATFLKRQVVAMVTKFGIHQLERSKSLKPCQQGLTVRTPHTASFMSASAGITKFVLLEHTDRYQFIQYKPHTGWLYFWNWSYSDQPESATSIIYLAIIP